MDTEQFLSEIEKRPILWNTSLKCHKNTFKKYETWVDIASLQFVDFNTKSEAEKKNKVQQLMSRWRSIRDNFVRFERQNLTSSGNIKHYKYEKQLKFLRKHMKTRPSNSRQLKYTNYHKSIDLQELNDDDTYYNENENISYIQPAKKSVASTSKPPASTKQQEIYYIEDKPVEFIDVNPKKSVTSTTKLPSSTKTQEIYYIEDKPVEFVDVNPKENITSDDEDMAFFKSILPSLRTLNMDQKFTFRIQTMQLIKKLIRSNSLQTPFQNHVYSTEELSRLSSASSLLSEFSLIDESQHTETATTDMKCEISE